MARTRKTRAAKAADDVEVLDQQEESCGTEMGMLVVTTIALLAAVVIIQMALKNHFGAGLF